MAMASGTRLGPYEVLSPIGKGGMGEVWKARDTRLDRTVAIKTSSAHFSDRFEREARAIAALNHPHICQIYDVGPDYLVMEYVEGAPLKGPLPLAKALEYGRQICDALDAAHRKGIVHRDLKPANILVAKSGVKLLDFGLAKFQGAATADQQTMSMTLTGAGQIVGTLQYMSPEQIQGAETDARSDIFSFGLVLYEAIAGRCAFRAENPASLMAAILKETPEPMGKLVPLTPPALERLVARAIEKDPERRWQSIRDVMLELESISLDSIDLVPTAESNAVRPRRGFAWKTVLATLLLASIGAAVLWRSVRDNADESIGRSHFLALTNGTDPEWHPVFSPNGKSIAFSRLVRGTYQVFVTALDGAEPVQIGECAQNCFPIGWSADSARVYYVDNDLWVAGASGGSARLLMQSVTKDISNTKPVTISPDGNAVVFARERPDGKYELAVSSPPGAPARPMEDFPPASKLLYMVRFSPDGRRLVVSVNTEIAVVPFPSGRPHTVRGLARGFNLLVDWLPDSRHIVYTRPGSGEIVVQDTETEAARLLLRGANSGNWLSVSPDGTRMAYQVADRRAGLDELAIDSGSVRRLRSSDTVFPSVAWSPSGDRYVSAETVSGRREITIYTADGSRVVQLTSAATPGGGTALTVPNWPAFSPDGRRVVFSQDGRIWTVPAGGGQPVPVSTPGENADAPAWSPDGKWIAYQRGASANRQLVKIDASGQGQPTALVSQGVSRAVWPLTRWSHAGAIAYSFGGQDVRVCREDGSQDRVLALGTRNAGDFDRRGDLFYGLIREAGAWKLATIEVSSGKVLRSLPVDAPSNVQAASLHPDGKRMIYAWAENGSAIWTVDGLPRPATGWLSLFRHWSE
jgi:eukaryotic-like serine/threonine-protein kinase